MLPLLHLDDRLFEQWVSDARKGIQKRYPDWTDENAHDPGITLLELFSWIGEMQQYYLSRIPASSERKFLKLLGMKLRASTSAYGMVEIGSVKRSGWMPSGVRIFADSITFETEQAVLLLSNRIDKIIVRTEQEANDFTSSNQNDGVAYLAFGQAARQGNRLYVGFDEPLPSAMDIELYIKLYEHYPVASGPYDPLRDSFVPSAQVIWQYYGEGEDQQEGWRDVNSISDETQHLSFSGKLVFRTGGSMKPLTLHPANDRPRYWISCLLVEDGYELPPKIDSISVNTVKVKQVQTMSSVKALDSDGQPNQSYTVNERLAYEGSLEVQVLHPDGYWTDWEYVDEFTGYAQDAEIYRVEKDTENYQTRIIFGDGTHGRIPPAGRGVVRMVCYEPHLEADRWVGTANSLPYQSYELPWKRIVADGFKLQTALPDAETGVLRWFDWYGVEDFDRSRSIDRHYILDSETGHITFGDHERGVAPAASGMPNIRVIALQLGGGVHGNVKRHMINQFEQSGQWWGSLSVTNMDDAAGGADAETLAEAKLRALLSTRNPERAVTDEDYERLAKLTPGLRVARVKTLALYKPGLSDYPKETSPAQTTVVVVPYSENGIPMPGRKFLYNVRKHLDPYRLITTELHVIAPEYVKITVHAVVIVEPSFKKDSPKIINAVNHMFRPIIHDKADKGWEFGRPVYKGDIYSLINQIKGVAYIQDLWLEADGTGVTKDKNGDILLPPHGLVYSGDHVIECISSSEL